MKEGTNLLTLTDARTRRQFFTGLAMVVGGLGAGASLRGESQDMKEAPAKPANRHRTSLHQETEIKAVPQRIYEALLSSKDFATFSGMPAEIDPKVGGAFSMFGGLIVGVTVELVADKRIVQAWRPAAWEPGFFSSARFELKLQGAGTLVVLDHTGFSEGKFDSLSEGWHSHYWEPLKKFLA